MADPTTAANTFWDLTASGVLKFLSDLIGAVAWPSAAAFIVNLFKNEIIERIPRLAELTLPGGISAKFNAVLNKVETDVEHEVLASPQETPIAAGNAEPIEKPSEESEKRSRPEYVETPHTGVEPDDSTPRYSVSDAPTVAESDTLALEINPAGVVMEAWKDLERHLMSFATAVLKKNARRYSPMSIALELRDGGDINSQEFDTLQKLITLRNIAAHSKKSDISTDDAARFADISQKVAELYEFKARKQRVKNRLNARI